MPGSGEPCCDVLVSREARQLQRMALSDSWCRESFEPRRDNEIEKPSSPDPTGLLLPDVSAARRSRSHVIGRRSVNQRPSGAEQVHIPSRSHTWFSIQVRSCKAFVTQIDCAPELNGRRELQVIGTKNLTRQRNSRAEFVRFLKVTRAGWHDVISRITRADLAASKRGPFKSRRRFLVGWDQRRSGRAGPPSCPAISSWCAGARSELVPPYKSSIHERELV